VRLRYRGPADHLAMVKRTIGPDRILLTCCSCSGPTRLNSMGLSYESFIDSCDWVMLENCGLTADTATWVPREPEAMLHRSVAALKPGGAPALAASYFAFADGAYLGWAIARFWGVDNWATTLLQGPFPDGSVEHDEPELVGDLNRWEEREALHGPGIDVPDLVIAFLRASRDNGWEDESGRDHWDLARAWAEACNHRNLGYRFLLGAELSAGAPRPDPRVPLVLDGCAHLSDADGAAFAAFLDAGGTLVVAPPLGTHDERGSPRGTPLADRLRTASPRLIVADTAPADERLERLIAAGVVTPRLRVVSGPAGWAIRLRIHEGTPVLHFMNRELAGIEHPTLEGRPPKTKVLHRIEARPAGEPLVIDVDLAGTGCAAWREASLGSPELTAPRAVGLEQRGAGAVRLAVDLGGLRMYAVVGTRD
jgi:hypothetical protein